MAEQPLISVLMTAYNREKYIAEGIESVLASSYTNFELIISDDKSADNTVQIARAYAEKDNRIKVFVNKTNLGDYLNRNMAASFAAGKYIKYLDSDDIMYPHCLSVMVYCMEKFPEAGFGLSAVGDESGPYPMCIAPYESYIEHFAGKGHFDRAPGSSIIKKEAFDKTGGFSGLRQLGDFEFWLKIGCYYPLVKMPVDLYWSRIHSDQESKVNSEKEKQKLRLKIIRKTFAEEKVPLSENEKQKVISSIVNRKLYKFIRKIVNN